MNKSTKIVNIKFRCVRSSWVTKSNELLSSEHAQYDVEKEKGGDDRDHRPDGGDVVSAGVCVRIVRDTARHSG